MSKLGELHVVRAQCANSTLVAKVKVLERSFKNDSTVEFQMYDAAPAAPPVPLPYFALPEGGTVTDEKALVLHLARQGAPGLLGGADGLSSTAEGVLDTLPGAAKCVKAALKSKGPEAMAANKEQLVSELAALEETAQAQSHLAGSTMTVADLAAMVELRPAFEKLLDPDDRRGRVPHLTAWYARCHGESAALQKLWGSELQLCSETVLDGGKKPKESKEDKKARERENKKARAAAKKAEAAAAPLILGAAAATAPSVTGPSASGRSDAEALPSKARDFPDWYKAIVIKSELLSYYDIPGIYVLRPAAYAMWEAIQDWFNRKIKGIGVENCLFPLFITKDKLEREAEHVEDFAPEVAWVTHSGDTPLEGGAVALRPTSETAMYPYFKDWIRSHRDLPLKLNQWTNVVRWEIKQRTPFVRSREFHWQEGHTAHTTEAEAKEMVLQILDWYRAIYEDLMAVPVIPGWKSQKEKFAGADATATVEAFIPETGKGIQGATSHALGQNFSKMFDIKFADDQKREQYAWQTSWGCTTRTLGVLVMTHGDDKGLVIPPRVASKHAVIVPITMASMSEDDRGKLADKAQALARELTAAGVAAHADVRENHTPGSKYAHWELRGMCLRLELGPRDMQKKSVLVVRRDTGAKESVAWSQLAERLPAMLQEMQAALLARAQERVDATLATVASFEEFAAELAKRKRILAPWCDSSDVEGAVKAATKVAPPEGNPDGGEAGAKTLCVPFEQPPLQGGQMCIFAKALLGEDRPAKNFALWGRSY